MNRLALVVLVAACGSEDKPAAPVAAAATPKETITAQLARCDVALPAPADPREKIIPLSSMGGRAGVPPNTPQILLGVPTVAGDLDAGIVRRIMRRHLMKFRYCFERELLANPKLAGGTVETAFAIQPSGQTASPTADGIDPEVSKCIALELRSVAFPAPLDKNQVQVSAQIEIRYTPRAAPDEPAALPPPARDVPEWTPFAITAPPAGSTAQPVEEVTKKVRERLPAIERCFDDNRGMVRAMIALDAFGRAALRAGGLGDIAAERCIERALAGIDVNTSVPVELACDITRGGEAPLRVSPDAGYTVIELTDHELRNRSSVRPLPPRGALPTVTVLGSASSVLVVAEPDAPGYGFDHALWWAPAGTTLVAVKAAGGAPVFLGMGDSRAHRQAATTKRVVQLRTDGGRMRACIPGEQLDASAPLVDAKQMNAVMQVVKSACERQACESTIVVGTSGDFVAKDLVATTSAARRAGFAQISIGGPACD